MFNKDTKSLILTSTQPPFFRFHAEKMPNVIIVSGRAASGKTIASIAILLDLIEMSSSNNTKALVLTTEIDDATAVRLIEKQLPRHNNGITVDLKYWSEKQNCELTVSSRSHLDKDAYKHIVKEIKNKKPDILFVDQIDVVTKEIRELIDLVPVVIVNCGITRNTPDTRVENPAIRVKNNAFDVVDINVSINDGYLRMTGDAECSTSFVEVEKLFESKSSI